MLEYESHCTPFISMYKPDEDVWTVQKLMICSLVFPCLLHFSTPAVSEPSCAPLRLCVFVTVIYTHAVSLSDH